MNKTELIKKMLDDMAEVNNTIDLNAYALGLSNMFDEQQKQVKNIVYKPVLGSVDSDVKEAEGNVLTAILYKHTCTVEMCVNEIDYPEVVKDIQKHFQ